MRLTPTQQRLMDALKDGQHHCREDLMACLYDDQSGVNALAVHIHLLKRVARRTGRTIASTYLDGKTYYRLVDMAGIPVDGHTSGA